jgi:hypothetical protein
LVDQFLESVRGYVSGGREFEYRGERSTGALAGGRLLVGQTAILWARGMRHLLAYERVLPTRRTLMNRVVLAGLREIEEIAPAAGVSAGSVVDSRALQEIFTDCLDAEVIRAPAERFAAHALTLMSTAGHEGQEDMLALAGVILSHEGFERESLHGETVPRAWFLNLERLFEQAVRHELRRAGRPLLAVSSAAGWMPTIFSGVPGELRADPDLVLHHRRECFAVGDAKYKELDGRPEASDLYQLLAHAAAFETDLAFLIYPGATFEADDLGTAATGCHTWVFRVGIDKLSEGAVRLLRTLELA